MQANILTHGALKPYSGGVELRAGRLTVMYEGGFIRYIRNGSDEIVRMINHYVRDSNWNTMAMKILSEQIETTADSFLIVYTASIKQNDIDFSWTCSITGTDEEEITFTIDGVANSDFMRNRLGFTVLHPAAPLRGQPCRITHADKTTVELYFPDTISPHQPFLDIRAMAWSPATGVQAALTFDGDIFEMEDQRNWLDATHKTYCTPLALGFPKKVSKGDIVRQTVHLHVFGDLTPADRTADILTFSVDMLANYTMPALGLPVSALPLTPAQYELVGSLDVDFVRITIEADDDVAARIREGLLFQRPLEVVLFPREAVEPVALALKQFAAHIRQVVVLPKGKTAADAALVDAWIPTLRRYLPSVNLGSGTDAFFTELNRNRTPAEKLDFLSFSVNPTTHANDIRTMTENLRAHSDVVESCRAFSGKEVNVGPITLKMRWNPDANAPEVPRSGELPANVDTRQVSLFAAAWTLGSIKYLAESGASCATYYEMAGWRGLMAHPEEPWPAAFSVAEDQVYPAFLILRELLARKHATILRLVSSDPLRLDGIVMKDDRMHTVILANYTSDTLSAVIPPEIVASTALVVSSDNIMALLRRPKEPLRPVPFKGDMISIPEFGFAVLQTSIS